MQAKAMRNYHLHHPFDNSPAAVPWPTDPPETVRKLADLTRNHAKATMQTRAERPLRDPGQQATHPFFQPHAPQPHHLQSHPSEQDRKGAHPPPTKPEKTAGQQPPNPPHPPRPSRQTRTKHPHHPPSHHYHHPTQTKHPHHPPSRHQPQLEAYPEFKKGAKVQQPFRNDHTGDWIWCEGTIQYRLRDLGPNDGVQIRVICHRQKELDQGNSAPDKPEGHTLELNSAHSIGLLTAENKAQRGTKYTGELPPEWGQGLPPPCLPKRPPPGKKSPGPKPPP